MADKTREQWVAAVRRWLVVGAVAGLAFGVFAHVRWDGSPGLLGALAFFVPLGAAMGLLLWAGAYRYDFVRVWGWVAAGWTVAALAALLGAGIGAGCLQGLCGDP